MEIEGLKKIRDLKGHGLVRVFSLLKVLGFRGWFGAVGFGVLPKHALRRSLSPEPKTNPKGVATGLGFLLRFI